ncbi:unnamed protein product [Rotaria sp. Silwood2]|nr:unnamed protein product [Rotaria sp. Silwood2]CAF2994360.1 unnamed protein product [Rotaria sp. Silwood2]CAF3262974.1 unnamed protein product [Rotaria sp. Silwood2]CAF3352820.1 unnamed protein product [Rotaria sp. Silwood2]CAF4074671.1 unnamed protein product [Rotaria sp. Silwood2]
MSKNRITQLDKAKQESCADLEVQLNHLPLGAMRIQQVIEKFFEENLASLRKKIEHKIPLVQYDFDEEVLKLEYLKQNPPEVQIQLAEELCTAKQQEELSKFTSELLDQQVIRYNDSTKFDQLPITRVALFDSIRNVDVQQHFYAQCRQISEQTKTDMITLYTQSATNQQKRYQNQFNDKMTKMREEQRFLPDEQKLTTKMIELIEQRAHLIEERLKCIYNFKVQTFTFEL